MNHRKSSIPLAIMTIEHSTRPVSEFIHLFKAHEVKRLVDVRTIPRSRHNPSSAETNCRLLCIPLGFTTGTCLDSAAFDMLNQIHSTPGGITPASVALRITCRHLSSRRIWTL